MHCGLAGGCAVILFLTRELDDEDGVFGGQADENDEADLRQYIDGHAAREQPRDGGEQAHRHDQHDRQRQLPAFVLRDKNEEHEEGGGAEDEESRRAELLLLESELRPLETDTLRKHLASKLLHAM